MLIFEFANTVSFAINDEGESNYFMREIGAASHLASSACEAVRWYIFV
jgi:hypothetical protein